MIVHVGDHSPAMPHKLLSRRACSSQLEKTLWIIRPTSMRRCRPNRLSGKRAAERHLVLLIFEDVHWIDPTTREALDLTTDRVPDSGLGGRYFRPSLRLRGLIVRKLHACAHPDSAARYWRTIALSQD